MIIFVYHVAYNVCFSEYNLSLPLDKVYFIRYYNPYLKHYQAVAYAESWWPLTISITLPCGCQVIRSLCCPQVMHTMAYRLTRISVCSFYLCLKVKLCLFLQFVLKLLHEIIYDYVKYTKIYEKALQYNSPKSMYCIPEIHRQHRH